MRLIIAFIAILLSTQLTAINSVNNFNYMDMKDKHNEITTQQLIHELERIPLTENNLKLYLNAIGVEHPEIVFQQAMLETGRLTSRIYKENNNLFGMKCPSKRFSKSTGENRGHSTYNSWYDSVYDYILWQKYWATKGYVQDDYYAFLNKVGYAEDVNYINKLRQIT